MGELDKKTVSFEKIDEIAREQAAGGRACAMYVLQLINAVDTKAELVNESHEVSTYDENGLAGTKNIKLLAKLDDTLSVGVVDPNEATEKLGGESFTLYALREPSPGVYQGFKLWTLKEVPADSDTAEIDPYNCSHAQFHPASDFGDWDWSFVATREDGQNPPSAIHAIERPYLTNKEIIVRLRSLILGNDNSGQKLVDDLMLKELAGKYLPSTEIDGLLETPCEERLRPTSLLENRRKIYALVGAHNAPVIEIAGLEFDQSLTLGNFAVNRIYTDMGTKPRKVRFGTLQPSNDGGNLVAYSNDDVIISDFPLTGEQIFDVPKIINAPTELLETVATLLKKYSNATSAEVESLKRFDAVIVETIRTYRAENNIDKDTYIDIGSLDVRHIPNESLFYVGPSWTTFAAEMGNFGTTKCIVDIVANSEQLIFTGDSEVSLFGCRVFGAKEAFKNVVGDYLEAYNCQRSFYSAKVTNSTAVDCLEAFSIGIAKGSIAENCSAAYVNMSNVENCIASYCVQAYIGRYSSGTSWINNTSEHCQESFAVNSDFFPRTDDTVRDNTIIVSSRSSLKYHALITRYRRPISNRSTYTCAVRQPSKQLPEWTPITNKKGDNCHGVRLTDKELKLKRENTAKSLTRLLLFGYSHVIASFVGYGNPDITVNSVVPVVDVPFIGDLPLPLMPIEIINDINNSSDHQAQGFKKPEGAVPVTANNAVEIPIISDYDVTDVPDASFIENDVNGPVEETIKPGMYMVDFKSFEKADLYTDTTLNVVGQSFSIEVDTSKPISIFTQDPKVAEKLEVRLSEDGSKLIVSAKPGQKLEKQGEKYEFYVYAGN